MFITMAVTEPSQTAAIHAVLLSFLILNPWGSPDLATLHAWVSSFLFILSAHGSLRFVMMSIYVGLVAVTA